MNIREVIRNYDNLEQLIKDDLRTSLLNGIPDNPNVKRLSAGCFTMNSSSLSKTLILSPPFYDFLCQRDILIHLADRIPVRNYLNRLIQIRDTGVYGDNRFHPQVVSNLKTILQQYGL